jgi:hypothetical protein
MFARNKQGERRVSPEIYRVLLTAHIIVSVGWLGAVFAKLALAVSAATASEPAVAHALYVSTSTINAAFPPMAVGTVVTGVLLSLGTKWGLLRHYWVATKLALTVGVITTAIRMAGPLGPGTNADVTSVSTLLISLSVAHLLLLGAATILSVYKPWGKLRARRSASTQTQAA